VTSNPPNQPYAVQIKRLTLLVETFASSIIIKESSENTLEANEEGSALKVKPAVVGVSNSAANPSIQPHS
jgi:hypothetical protein